MSCCPNGYYKPLIRDCTGTIRTLNSNEHLVIGEAEAYEIILDDDMDLYISPSGSDTTGLGTEAKPFRSIYKARDEVLKYNPGDYTITINADYGKYNMDRDLIPIWLYGGRTYIQGAGGTIASVGFPATLTAADAAATNDGDYPELEYIDCEIQFDANYDAILDNITSGMFIVLYTAAGGTNPTRLYGLQKVISWNSGTRTAEVRIWRQNGDALFPSGAVSITDALLLGSVLQCAGSHGIYSEGMNCGHWNDVVLEGDKDSYDGYYGISLRYGGVIDLYNVGIHCFKHGIYCSQATSYSYYNAISKVKNYGQYIYESPSRISTGINVTGYGSGSFFEYIENDNESFSITASIAGGYSNTVSSDSDYGVIPGGLSNEIDDSKYCAIGGGFSNYINDATYATIAGGYNHTISGTAPYAAILGGRQHTIDGAYYGLIIGGYINSISSNSSVIISGQTNVIGTTCVGAFIGSGINNNITAPVTDSHYSGVILASNCDITDSTGATIGGGYDHEITDDSDYSCIFGGYDHTINTDSTYCFLGGGYQNIITNSLKSLICGGNENTLSGSYSAIVGGTLNIIDANYGYIGAGFTNTVYSTGGVVVSGSSCDIEANCTYSAIVTGSNNEIKDAAEFSVIASGEGNRIQDANKSFIGTGYINKIGTYGSNCHYSGIVAGYTNELRNGFYGFIGSGYQNIAGTEGEASYCAIVNGYGNIIERGSHSTIFSGYENTIAYTAAVSSYSLIIGGRDNTVTDSYYSSILNGRYHNVDAGAHYSTIGSGYRNTASGYSSFVIGFEGKSINYCEHAHGTARHDSTSGSAQTSVMVVANTTTNDTWTALYTDNSSKNMDLPPNAAWSFRALVTGQKTDGSQAGGYELTGCVRRDGAANAVAVGTLPTTGTVLGEDDANWDCRAVVTGTALRIEVLGVAATTINWTARVEVSQVIVES